MTFGDILGAAKVLAMGTPLGAAVTAVSSVVDMVDDVEDKVGTAKQHIEAKVDEVKSIGPSKDDILLKMIESLVSEGSSKVDASLLNVVKVMLQK